MNEELAQLYEEYLISTSRAPKHAMRGHFNDVMLKSLAYLLGFEKEKPEQGLARMVEYYAGRSMVSTQQQADAFIALALQELVSGGAGSGSLKPSPFESAGLPPELIKALSRNDIKNFDDLYGGEWRLTERQLNMLRQMLNDKLDSTMHNKDSQEAS